MGQYHSIYNVTKRERIRIGGAKLWEQAHSATAAALLLLLANSNGRGGGDFNTYPANYDKLTPQELANRAVIEHVSGRWSGDKIVVQGDYAKPTDPGYFDPDVEFTDITEQVCAALLITDDGDNSKILQIIEQETASNYGSPRKISSVVKVKATDRNGQTVLKYIADIGVAPIKPKRKTSKRKTKLGLVK